MEKTRIDQIQDLEQKATQLIKEGRDRSAITEYESIRDLLDQESPKLAETYLNLAQRWRVLGNKRESIQYYVKAIEQTEYLNEDSMHEDLAYLCYELAQFFRQIIREKPAKIFFEKALSSAKIAYGDNSALVQKFQAAIQEKGA